jgi:molybdenum cofactor sulfurtransferase
MIYLDNAGSAQLDPSILLDIHNLFQVEQFGNPHSQNPAGLNSHQWIENTRDLILNMCNTNKNEYFCIFTQNATHSIKLVGEFFDWKDSSFYYTKSNHNSIIGIREYAIKNDANVYVTNFEGNIINNIHSSQETGHSSKALFAIPAECNFSGKLPAIDALNKQMNYPSNSPLETFVLLDCAKFISTNKLDLSKYKPDFVPFSIYKICGYPTNLGVLLVKKSSANVLNKTYFGGGTYDLSISEKYVFKPRKDFIEKFEDGTIGFLSIIEANICLTKYLKHVNYTYIKELTKYAYYEMLKLKHYNNTSLVKFYGIDDIENHGSIIAFNLYTLNKDPIGYKDVETMANKHGICLRVGCFCNPGACSDYLELDSKDVEDFYEQGHRCWDNKDLINKRPTGAVRISIGYRNSKKDIDGFIHFLKENYILQKIQTLQFDQNEPHIKKIIVYPIKSCQGFEVDEWPISEYGFLYDRMFVIYDDKGRSVTLKRNMKLGKINPIINLEKEEIILESPEDNEVISFKISNFTNQRWFINEWLSKILEEKVEIVKMEASQNFSNTNQYLILNWSSLLDLNYKILNGSRWFYYLPEFVKTKMIHLYQPIDYIRFRPNIIIGGINSYHEDNISSIDCNGIILKKEDDCNRCYTTTINPNKQSQDDQLEPMKTLLKYRKFENRVIFGALFGNDVSIFNNSNLETSKKILKVGEIKIQSE